MARCWAGVVVHSPQSSICNVARRVENLLYAGSTHHLIRHWIGNAANDENYTHWAVTEILERIPADLFRATELYFDLFRDAHIGLEIQAEVREQVLAKAKTEFIPMTPQTFAKCLPPHFPYTLSHLVRLDSKSVGEPLRTRLEDWAWLKPQILGGLRERPDILVPHVLPLFGTFGPHPGPFETFKFDDEAVSRFFGEDRPEFYRLIAGALIPEPKVDANFSRLLPLAADAAQYLVSVIDAEKTPEC